MQKFIIRQIALPPDIPKSYALDAAEKLAAKAKVKARAVDICRFSVDSRKKNDIRFVYSVILSAENITEKQLSDLNAVLYTEPSVKAVSGCEERHGKIAVIGFGPAGIFSALTLADNGYKADVFERGGGVEERAKQVEKAIRSGMVDEESNVQFGAGGAGTFSDGKLMTRINDPVCSYVLKRFVEFGAPEEILYNARPHIGTDVLRKVISNVTEYLKNKGVLINFNTKIDDITEYGGGIKLSFCKTSEYYDAAVLACGHSARDTYNMLYRHNTALESKPFSVGFRIEHLQENIDRAMYGAAYDKYRDFLPHAEYNLSKRCVTGGVERGVYTFCMCPGGEVILASTERDGIVTNGMSHSKRNGANANSAVAVSVFPSDCGDGVMSGVEFQRKIERAAFLLGGKDKAVVPVQTVGSYLSNKPNVISSVTPSCRNEKTEADVSKVFPGFVNEMLKCGLYDFGKKIKGFDDESAVITAPETRTSSPVRILRDGGGRSLSVPSLYPCGEGAGYAGGITSAACDGIKTALKIIERFRPDYES